MDYLDNGELDNLYDIDNFFSDEEETQDYWGEQVIPGSRTTPKRGKTCFKWTQKDEDDKWEEREGYKYPRYPNPAEELSEVDEATEQASPPEGTSRGPASKPRSTSIRDIIRWNRDNQRARRSLAKPPQRAIASTSTKESGELKPSEAFEKRYPDPKTFAWRRHESQWAEKGKFIPWRSNSPTQGSCLLSTLADSSSSSDSNNEAQAMVVRRGIDEAVEREDRSRRPGSSRWSTTATVGDIQIAEDIEDLP